MSKKLQRPILQASPFQKFTIRLIDGHFVRVPKLDQIAVTDATRPATAMPPMPPKLPAPSVVSTDMEEKLAMLPDPPPPTVEAGGKTTAAIGGWALSFGTQVRARDLPSEKTE